MRVVIRWIRVLRNAADWVWRRALLIALLAMMALFIAQEGPPPGAMSTHLDRLTADVTFDFLGWEAEALWVKLTHWVLSVQRYMPETERTAFVRDTVERMRRMADLSGQIETAYTDPQVVDPATATAQARQELARLRAEAAVRQPIAEAIIEEQVAVVLYREGLAVLGQPFPPVGIRFTPLPTRLVVSPRERIETTYSQSLSPGLDVAQWEVIEEQVEGEFDVSALVTNIGGLSAWPAMLLEYPDLPWMLEVTAHEWTHHRLDLSPLGWEYDRRQETRTINETTASIVGKEVGRAALALYYFDLLPPEAGASPPLASEPPAFDFNAQMHATRMVVDQLLERGLVEVAEQYMERRRQFFWEQGYQIRRLNQAYFAFHGSYADEPGAAGEDPVGPAVCRLREQSPSLRAFLSRIGRITTLAQLEETLGD